MTNPDVARLESERLRPMPPEPSMTETFQELIGLIYHVMRQHNQRLPQDPRAERNAA